MWTDEYKKAIEQAAWLSGVNIISAVMKDEDGVVVLHANCDRKENVREVKDIFYKSLLNDLGENQPFLVEARPTQMIIEENVVYGAGAWGV